MRKTLIYLICFLITTASLTNIPNTSAMSKIDARLQMMGLDKDEVTGVFVELSSPTVVGMSTFGGARPFDSRELMNPSNRSTKFYELAIAGSQKRHLRIVGDMTNGAKALFTYQYAFNGYYIETQRRHLVKIAALPEVKTIFHVEPQKLHRTRSRKLIGAEKVWQQVKDPTGKTVDGSGVLVSVMDSGLDYTHPDFGKQLKPVGPKVVISRDLGMNDNDCQEEPKTMSSHGTSCASLIAGDGPDNPRSKAKEKGVAPKATLAGYKIQRLTDDGYILYPPGIMAGWEFTIKDKIDVSNNSWGRPGGDPQFATPQLNCALAGCTVVVSNGNEGSPGQLFFPIPQGQSAAADSVIGVGATDETDTSMLDVVSSVDLDYAGNSIHGYWGNTGKVFTQTDRPLEVVDCLWGRPNDFNVVDCKGKVALVQRGPRDSAYGEAISFKEKVVNAANAGAKAIILYNHSWGKLNASYFDEKSNEKPSDFNFIPSYELNRSQGETLRNLIHKGHEWKETEIDKNQNKLTISFSQPTNRANIAVYSSNGPTNLGFLKPDVCAPGINIHAALPYFLRGDYGDYEEGFGGTSAAAPFVSGCAALIRQGRPSWDPFEIKRSLMNTAVLMKRTDGRHYLPMTVQGMGRVDVLEAIKTDTLIQPPSALIEAKTGKINIADRPGEGLDQLPEEVRGTAIPFKLSNYSGKPVTYSISIEINSGKPEQIDVNVSATSVTVPAAGKSPGVAWIGVDVKLPGVVRGALNDIIIWFSDKSTGKKLHAGICVYNFNPRIGGSENVFATDVRLDKNIFSPNEDGVDDRMEISYDVTNGSWAWNWDPPLWSNYGEMLSFYALDDNGDKWSLIHVVEEFEIGPGGFVWDGKDVNGNYLLPDGDWKLGVSALCVVPDESGRSLVMKNLDFGLPTTFAIEKSTLPPMPTLTAFLMPIEPGMGGMFEVGICVSNASNLKEIKFGMNLKDIGKLAMYMGYEKGEFMTRDEPNALFGVDFKKEKDLFDISIQRSLDGVSGQGCILRLKFMATESNYLDIRFSNIQLTVVGDDGKDKTAKAFAKPFEAAIIGRPREPADFNRDGSVDWKDLDLLIAAMGSVEGDNRYNWRCDLNYDRRIDVEDYAIFARSYSVK